MRKRTLMVMSLILLLCGGMAEAQAAATPFVALDSEDQFWFYNAPRAPRLLADNGPDIFHPQWDSAGQYLAFTRYHPVDNTSSLWVFDSRTGSVFQLAEGLTGGMPVTFTLDNAHILYGITGDRIDSTQPEETIDIYRIAPSPDAAPERIGSFRYGIGCGGGIETALSWAFAQETGTTPGWGFLTLVETPYGILHSGDCGGRDSALLDPNSGEDKPLPGDFHRISVSPDRTQVIGFTNDPGAPLWLIDLASFDSVPLTISQTVSDIAWGKDGAIFFSGPRNDDAHEWGIWKLELTNRRLTLLYRLQNTYRLSRLTMAGDDAAVYFSQIVQPTDFADDAPITVNLLRLDLQTRHAESIGSDVHQAAISPLAR